MALCVLHCALVPLQADADSCRAKNVDCALECVEVYCSESPRWRVAVC